MAARDCSNRRVTYNYGVYGERLNGHASNYEEVKIITIGDSFTHGLEVSDHQTYSTGLEKILGVPVANMGVSGYDMLQPVLRLEQTIAYFPNAKYVVFAFIDDDLFRTVDSYRPQYEDSWRRRNSGLLFKPHIRHGKIIPLDFTIYNDVESMRKALSNAWKNDYWAMPDGGFPYSYTLLQKLTSHPGMFHIASHLGKKLYGEPYYFAFDMPEIMEGYKAAIDHFLEVAQRHSLVPILVRLPSHKGQRRSSRFLEDFTRKHYGHELLYADLSGYVDFRNYRKLPCHPTV